jgi:hypothetical protein
VRKLVHSKAPSARDRIALRHWPSRQQKAGETPNAIYFFGAIGNK